MEMELPCACDVDFDRAVVLSPCDMHKAFAAAAKEEGRREVLAALEAMGDGESDALTSTVLYMAVRVLETRPGTSALASPPTGGPALALVIPTHWERFSCHTCGAEWTGDPQSPKPPCPRCPSARPTESAPTGGCWCSCHLNGQVDETVGHCRSCESVPSAARCVACLGGKRIAVNVGTSSPTRNPGSPSTGAYILNAPGLTTVVLTQRLALIGPILPLGLQAGQNGLSPVF